MFHIEDPQISGTTTQNLVSQATWHLEFVHSAICDADWLIYLQWGIATTGLECHKVCSQSGLSPIFPAML